MNPTIRQLESRIADLDLAFRERTLRERMLIGATIAAVLLMAIDTLAIRPVEAQHARIETSIEGTRQDIAMFEAQLRELREPTMTEDEQRMADEIEQLTRQVAAIDARLREEITALVPPEAIVSILEEILDETHEVRLVALESDQPERIGSQARTDGQDLQIPEAALYRHGLRLELEGTFEGVVDYVGRLEASPWHLLWDRLEIAVVAYPTNRVLIELHTISEEEEWIGV